MKIAFVKSIVVVTIIIAKIWPRFARPFSLRLSYYNIIAFSDFRSRSTYADGDMEINCVCP